MNWFIPEINRSEASIRYVCWVIVLLCILCLIGGCTFIVLTTPLDSLYRQGLAEHYSTIAVTLTLLLFVLAAYAFPVEHQKMKALIWNRWRARDLSSWQDWTHRHYVLVDSAVLSTYQQLLELIKNGGDLEAEGVKHSLFSDNFSPPGLGRFDLMCKHLLNDIKSSLEKLNKKENLLIYLQLDEFMQRPIFDSANQEESLLEKRIKRQFETVWKSLGLSIDIEIHIVTSGSAMETLWERLDDKNESKYSALVITAKYQTAVTQGCDELASAVLILPDYSTSIVDFSSSACLYRGMDSTKQNLPEDIKHLIEAGQQPLASIDEIWHSGLDEETGMQLNVIANELKIPLNKEHSPFGIISLNGIVEETTLRKYWYLLALSGLSLKKKEGACLLISTGSDSEILLQIVGNRDELKKSFIYDRNAIVFPLGSISASLALVVPFAISIGDVFPTLGYLGLFFSMVLGGGGLIAITIFLHQLLCSAIVANKYYQ